MGQPVKFSFFCYSGSPHAAHYRACTLTGELDHAHQTVAILYEERLGQQTNAWRKTLASGEYAKCVTAINRTALRPDQRFGGGCQLLLTDADGETQTGEPVNMEEWTELARQIEQRHGPEAAKKRKLMMWAIVFGLYVAFQLLLVLVWLICFLLGIGGPGIHLILVLVLLLAILGAVAGLFIWPRKA